MTSLRSTFRIQVWSAIFVFGGSFWRKVVIVSRSRETVEEEGSPGDLPRRFTAVLLELLCLGSELL